MFLNLEDYSMHTPPFPLVRLAASAVLILAGLVLAGTGYWWAQPVLAVFQSFPGGQWMQVPVPFLPIACIGVGALLFTRR